jgi:hypothetical protein
MHFKEKVNEGEREQTRKKVIHRVRERRKGERG